MTSPSKNISFVVALTKKKFSSTSITISEISLILFFQFCNTDLERDWKIYILELGFVRPNVWIVRVFQAVTDVANLYEEYCCEDDVDKKREFSI